jgi:class 3 adenylate cyclase
VGVPEKLAQTFLFADLAGFTALTEAHGDEEAADLAQEFFDRVRGLLPRYGGQEVKTIGDAVMLRCVSPAAAVALGLDIVDEVRKRDRFPIVRVGMHAGPATERHGDWFGAAVNVAARVSASAGGNEVLITNATREAAGKLDGVEFRHHGLRRFKNVGEPVEVYRAVRLGEKTEGLPIDPVCRMAIDPGQAVGSLKFDGREYFFCSLECSQAFSAAPDAYAIGD